MSIRSIYKLPFILVILTAVIVSEGCVTKKRKKEVSKVGKFYHNLTSEFNGYFNANELMLFAMLDLQAAHTDNYTEVLGLYDYTNVSDGKIVAADMDKAIEKVTRVAALHEPGDWVDDCYVLMGKAQYYKQDYETAIETFEYFQEDFNPANPYGRNFKSRKVSAKEAKKQRKKERKAKKKAQEKARKAKAKQKEEDKKERAKANRKRKKSPKKRSRGKKKRPAKKDTNTKEIPSDTKEIKTEAPTDKPKTTVPKKPIVKPQVDKSAYHEGLVWLAMSYNRIGKFTTAEFLLNRLDKINSLKAKVGLNKIVARADNLIQTENEFDAIEHLDLAISHKKATRAQKGRYAFVAGQILMKEGLFRDAAPYFKKAKKKSRDNKMKFMSELNYIKCSQMQGGRSKTNFAGKLEKMLKETKNEAFKDEIYFALGEIAVNNENIEDAKKYFSKSAGASSENSLKTEAYYRLANITIELEDYVSASAYYDSTLMVIAKEDDRRREVKKYAENLKDIAANIKTIKKLDEAIAMANMSDEELMKIAKQRLEEEKKTGKLTDTKVGNEPLIKRSKGRAVLSDYWAYNTVKKESGKIEFINKWGNRPLTDNWRLESKIEAVIEDVEIEEQTEEVASNKGLTKEEYDRLMADVPDSPLAVGKLEEQVRKAMFALGKQYRDKIQNYVKSYETLETLGQRFGKHVDRLDAFYYLYLDYLDTDQPVLAEKYKNMIIEEFPESTYGQLLTNPAYAKKLAEERKKIDRYYDKTYDLFNKGEYATVTERVKVADKNFGKENKLKPKFTLLNAMSLGFIEGKKAYIKALNDLVLRHPNTPEELKAKEILRLLKGDKSAFDGLDVKAVDEMFKMDEKSRHYVAVILFDFSDDILQSSKISISDYNKQYHSQDRLQMGEMLLNQTENTQLILIRSFKNQEKAMAYYNGVEKSRDLFIPKDLVNYELLPITQKNYRKVLQQRTHTNYRAYFQSNYLDKE